MAGRPVAPSEASGCLLRCPFVVGRPRHRAHFTSLDPIKALYWSAVVNGVLAAPVMAMLMALVRRRRVMGELVVRGGLYWLGWTSTAAMALCTFGMIFSFGS